MGSQEREREENDLLSFLCKSTRKRLFRMIFIYILLEEIAFSIFFFLEVCVCPHCHINYIETIHFRDCFHHIPAFFFFISLLSLERDHRNLLSSHKITYTTHILPRESFTVSLSDTEKKIFLSERERERERGMISDQLDSDGFKRGPPPPPPPAPQVNSRTKASKTWTCQACTYRSSV